MSPPLTGLPQNTKDSPQQSAPSRGGSPASPEVTPPPPPKLWGHKDLALSPQTGTAVEGHPASERAMGSAKASRAGVAARGLPPPDAPSSPCPGQAHSKSPDEPTGSTRPRGTALTSLRVGLFHDTDSFTGHIPLGTLYRWVSPPVQ